MCAAQYNHLPVITVLAEHCANANYTSTKNEGLTALHYAVMNGNEEIVNELLNAVAYIYPSRVSNKTSPVHYAAANGYLNLFHENGGILDLPVGDENGDLPIHLASKRGHENIVRWLHERQEFSLFAWNKQGKTPLHKATVFRRINVIIYIIDTAGTHVDMTTLEAFKLTLLHLASSEADETIINYLLDRRADVNRMSAENRYTPMHYATIKNFPDCMKLLYQAGGNVNVNAREEAATGRGEHLLITVVKYNSCDAAKFLLSTKSGLNPDYQDNDGLTALHYDVEYANLQLTDILVSKGALVYCQDNWKQTPLHCAVQTENTFVFQEILRVHPSLKTEDIYGKIQFTRRHYSEISQV